MKIMKKFVTGLFALALLASTSYGIYASTGYRVSESNQDPTQSVDSVVTQQHKVAVGYAAHAFGTFWNNDWDNASISSGNWSAEDIAKLKSRQFSAGTTWYYDVTGDVVSTAPFSDYETFSIIGVTASQNTAVQGGQLVRTVSTHVSLEQENHSYQVLFNGYDSSPIVLDVNRDMAIDVANGEWTKHAPRFNVQYAKFFDITGDGSEDYTEWVAHNPGDALLAMPENGEITGALQLFGTAGGYSDGYEKLSLLFDKDNNGWVEGAELEGLALWIDANSDGTFQKNELRTLNEFGVTAISTSHSNYVSAYKAADGSVAKTWDWWPCVAQCRKFEK